MASLWKCGLAKVVMLLFSKNILNSYLLGAEHARLQGKDLQQQQQQQLAWCGLIGALQSSSPVCFVFMKYTTGDFVVNPSPNPAKKCPDDSSAEYGNPPSSPIPYPPAVVDPGENSLSLLVREPLTSNSDPAEGGNPRPEKRRAPMLPRRARIALKRRVPCTSVF